MSPKRESLVDNRSQVSTDDSGLLIPPTHPRCGITDELQVISTDPAILSKFAMVVELAASDQPEQFVDAVSRHAGVGGDMRDGLLRLVVGCPALHESERHQNALDVHIWLAVIDEAQLLQEIAGQWIAKAEHFL